ncbi:MAG: hypothetical protein BWX84_02609 [Verrucomicrobia bacterium ADurb.Bin118]|nr:MAG: hypothetical protein BWX84_02609 [Verrucomicrobia bacterium ADurb.Bin118]
MPFVKLVEDQRRHTAELRIVNQLPEQHPLGDVANPRRRAADIFKPDRVADLAPERDAQLRRHPRGQQPGGQPPRLEDDHLARAQQTMPEEHLRDLGGFARTGGGGHDEPPLRLQRRDQIPLNLVNGQTLGHVASS